MRRDGEEDKNLQGAELGLVVYKIHRGSPCAFGLFLLILNRKIPLGKVHKGGREFCSFIRI